MKKLVNNVSVIAMAILFLGGCAGITDANLSEADVNSAEVEMTNITAKDQDTSGFTRHQDDTVVIIFGGGDREDMVDIRPDGGDDDDR